MRTIALSLSWIAFNIVLLSVFSPTYCTAQNKEITPNSYIVTAPVKASFSGDDKNKNIRSYWSGQILLNYSEQKKSQNINIGFQVRLGEHPSYLNMHWTLGSGQTVKSSGPVFISIVNSNAEPSDILAWVKLKESNDPSMVISLSASTGKRNEYTNEDEIEGKIIVWLRNKKETDCLPLAKVEIPERSILLKYSADKQSEPSIELNIQTMRIVDFEDDAWDRIIKSGNIKTGLPSNLEDVECKSFVARNDINQMGDSKNIAELQYAFIQAYKAGDFDINEMKKLVGFTDECKLSEINADYSRIFRNQLQCQRLVNDILKSGKIKTQNTKPIMELGNQIFSHSAASARSSGRRIPPPSHSPAGPEVTYYVRQAPGAYVSDGTSEHPYRSILQAYDAAKSVDSRRVELIVDEGFYDEQLNLDRNTILTAAQGSRPIIASTVVCTRALRLEMTGLTLLGAPSPGALQVLVPGSSVYLVDVEISEAHRYGIYQRGGELNLRSVTIHHTRRESGQMEYGSGMVLQDGVRAFLATVTLNENESSGIILRGRDSYLAGLDVTLRGNKLHANFYSEAVHNPEIRKGAFLVYDQAYARLTRLHMHENEFFGLGVYDNAEVIVNDAIINYTRYIHLADEDLTEEDRGLGRVNNWGGVGIAAKNGGHIDMRNFLVSHCDLVGVAIHDRGEIDLHDGWVSYNIIGVHIAWSFDITRLMDLVAYYENENNLQSDAGLPVPDGTPVISD